MKISKETRNSINMPLIGYGTYQLSTEEAEFGVKEALKIGFKHIDSAEGYENEEGTGRAIKASGISRDELFVTTKLLPGYKPWELHEKTYSETIETLKKQLKQLQIDYTDLYLIHVPLSELRLEQWEALIEIKKMGLAKHIGVSNYNEATIQEILDAGLYKPEANQIEFHPLRAQKTLTQYMKQHSINPIAYSSLAPLATWRADEGQGGDLLAEAKVNAQSIISDISSKLKVSDAQLLLRWGMQNDYCVLAKSIKPERIRENLDIFNFEISSDDMERLGTLNKEITIAWAGTGIVIDEAIPTLKK